MTLADLSTRGRVMLGVLAGLLVTLSLVTVVLYATQRPSASSSAMAPSPQPSASSTFPRPGAPSASTDTEDHDHDHDAAADDMAGWEPVVLGFAKNFPRPNDDADVSAAEWRKRLAPYVSPAVADQLADVDPAKVPPGSYVDYEVLTPGSYQIAVKVTYRERWALVLYATSDGRTWHITAYDRFSD